MNSIFNSHSQFDLSSSLAQQKRTAMHFRQQQQRQQQQQVSKNAFVLNWEDVLAPVSLLHHRIGLQPSRSALAQAQALFASDAYLQQAIYAIEDQILELLRIASSMGPTYIVSERSMAFMEATCASFFPRLAIWLAHASIAMPQSQRHRVQVITAPRTKFASEMEKAAWRVNTVQAICKDSVAPRNSRDQTQQQMLRSPASGTLGLIHVSAVELDTFACVKAIDVAPFLLPKCVQVASAPSARDAEAMSLEKFFAQLRTLQRYIVSAAAHSNAFAVEL